VTLSRCSVATSSVFPRSQRHLARVRENSLGFVRNRELISVGLTKVRLGLVHLSVVPQSHSLKINISRAKLANFAKMSDLLIEQLSPRHFRMSSIVQLLSLADHLHFGNNISRFCQLPEVRYVHGSS
jgi:hypothetical protein